MLRRYRPDWLEDRPFTVMDSADINAAVKACKDELRLGKGDRSFPRTQAIVGFLSKARNKEMRLDEVLQREAFHLLPYAEPLMRLGEAYDAYRKEKGLLDYDDLLFELEHLLRTNERAAGNLRRRYTHILVDEYQDTNLVQARIVRLLAGPEGEGLPPATSWPWATRPSPSMPSGAPMCATSSIPQAFPRGPHHPAGGELPLHQAHPGRGQQPAGTRHGIVPQKTVHPQGRAARRCAW